MWHKQWENGAVEDENGKILWGQNSNFNGVFLNNKRKSEDTVG